MNRHTTMFSAPMFPSITALSQRHGTTKPYTLGTELMLALLQWGFSGTVQQEDCLLHMFKCAWHFTSNPANLHGYQQEIQAAQ